MDGLFDALCHSAFVAHNTVRSEPLRVIEDDIAEWNVSYQRSLESIVIG